MEIRLLAVQAHEAGLATREIAELAGVSQTTIDNWRRTWRREGMAGLARKTSSGTTRRICKELEERIVAHREEHPEHGVRRIRDDLRREQGLSVSAETVRRVVNEADLGAPPQQPKRRPPAVRRFERAVPNALWQIDIFTFELKRMYRVYLIGIIDDHSRYIVGHGLFRQQKADAVLEVVKGAIGQWGAPREILSDNGRQFVAWRGKSAFQKTLKRQGIQHVRSAPHHPMTLGKIERFWKTIWTEFLEDAVFASFADASQRIGFWIGHYNHQRPHQGIGGACPADRFYGIAGDVEEALRQGCADNALRMALGNEPQPPLFLLGRLGDTDLRVTRKGEDVEVRVGDSVHEVIRLGPPMSVASDGSLKRREEGNAVEGVERRGAVSAGGDGPQGARAHQGDLRDLRAVPADPSPGDEQGGRGGGAGAGAQGPGQEGQDAGGGPGRRVGGHAARAPQGARTMEDEVPGRPGLPGAGAQVRPRGAGRAGLAGDAEKKNASEDEQDQTTQVEAQEVEPDVLGVPWFPWGGGTGGDWT
jgi:transposase InsO family protein